MSSRVSRPRLRPISIALASLLFLLGLAGSSSAATSGSIDHVEPASGGLKVLYSIPGLPENVTPDLGSLRVTVDGKPVDASAGLAANADAQTTVRRTAILAIDVSNSMHGERFAQAKLAAKAFLDAVSPDVYVGIVAFAGDVTTAQQPTLDRAASAQVIDQLTLSVRTRLYDGVAQAVQAAGSEGQRSVLVLSDGRDTTKTPLSQVTATIKDAAVQVDVVALAQRGAAARSLDRLAKAGKGSVLSADDPASLTKVFSTEAQTLAKQLLVTAQLPAGSRAKEGTVAVSIDAGGATYSDSAFVTLMAQRAIAVTPAKPQAPPAPGFAVSKNTMLVSLGVAGLSVLLLLLGAFGVFGDGKQKKSVEDRIAAYSRSGSGVGAGSMGSQFRPGARPAGLTGSAVGIAEKALASNKGLAASVGERLEAAGMSLKSAEWLLLHAGIAVGAGFVGFLVSSGGLLLTFLFLLAGVALPWVYLGFKRKRRMKAFGDQLADTLQLISGGLSAGLSLAQSIDTVVRQGAEPMTTEFKRVLVEARLGVSIEDALESLSERMQSKDFKWVVIAVRIQRDVGGNLSEVLGQVAATIRERGYLQRQVKSLSAEGKMSAWILGALPVCVLVFLMLTNRAYLAPMLDSLLGWMLMGAGVVLMTLAVFWMRNLIRMEV